MSATWTYRDKLPRQGARDGDYVFDIAEGERGVQFFERRLWIPEGDLAGQRFRCPPWMEKYVRALYGWRRRSDHGRRYRRTLVGIPRGNLKSMLGSGIALKGLAADRVKVPVVIGAGTDRPNAAIIFGYSSYSARHEPALRRRMEIFDGTKRIKLKKGEGSYRVIAADAAHSHGGHPTVIMVDDLQAQPKPALISVLRTSQITLADSLFAMLMTAGLQRTGVGWEEWQLALELEQDAALDPEYLACLFYADADDDIEDPAVQLKANPSLGFSIREEEMRAAVRRAMTKPSERNEILTLNFNIWTDAAKMSWIPPERWTATAGQPIDERELRGRECWAGVVASSSVDIASVAYVFPPRGDADRYIVALDAFVPELCTPKLEDEFKIRLSPFVEEGWLSTTEGDVIDNAEIVRSIERRRSSGWLVQGVAANPRNAADLIRRIQDAGFEVVAVTPGFAAMSPAMTEWEKLVNEKRIQHGADRLLAWMMRNLRAKRTGLGELAPDGEHSTGNITGPVAGLMALGQILGDQEPVRHWGVA